MAIFKRRADGSGPDSSQPALTGDREIDRANVIAWLAARDRRTTRQVLHHLSTDDLDLHTFHGEIQVVPRAVHKVAHDGEPLGFISDQRSSPAPEPESEPIDVAALAERLALAPIANQLAPLLLDDIMRLEKQAGAQLPTAYRHFVRSLGRCRFERLASVLAASGAWMPISKFFGAPVAGRTDDVLAETASYRKLIGLPLSYIAIARNEFGDPFFLDMREGWVVTVDFSIRTDTQPEFVVGSFDEFLARVAIDTGD